MRKINVILTLLMLVGCSANPRPVLAPDDCAARLDCKVVNVSNDSKYDVDVRINGSKYGDIPAYGHARYSLFNSSLIHGNCAVVTAKDIKHGTSLRSDEQCVQNDEYFKVSITNSPDYVWLTPYRVR